jgi:hypothetical protein
MRRRALIFLALCSACAAGSRTRVVVPYRPAEPVDRVAVEAANATGNELPMPQPGIIEQAVRFVLGRPQTLSTIAEAFARAAADRLAAMHVHVESPRVTADQVLRITLRGWEVRDGVAAGTVVFVSADYELLDPGGNLLWEVAHDHLPIRLGGPNLSRHEVERIARNCIDSAFASLPAAPAAVAR